MFDIDQDIQYYDPTFLIFITKNSQKICWRNIWMLFRVSNEVSNVLRLTQFFSLEDMFPVQEVLNFRDFWLQRVKNNISLKIMKWQGIHEISALNWITR